MTKKKHTAILQYSCLVGDPQPIIEGKRPFCADCASKRMSGVIEVTLHGLWEDGYITVMRCNVCHALTAYHYRIDLTLPEGEQSPISAKE